MQGRTVEKETGAELPFTAIAYTAAGVARSSASDGGGRFSVPADPGTVVRFVAVGRVPVEVTASAGGSPVLIELRESTTELDPLTVYGSTGPGKHWLAFGVIALMALLATSRSG
jgi:hypothetical protein